MCVLRLYLCYWHYCDFAVYQTSLPMKACADGGTHRGRVRVTPCQSGCLHTKLTPALISRLCIYTLSILRQSFLSYLEPQAHVLWLPGASLCSA